MVLAFCQGGILSRILIPCALWIKSLKFQPCDTIRNRIYKTHVINDPATQLSLMRLCLGYADENCSVKPAAQLYVQELVQDGNEWQYKRTLTVQLTLQSIDRTTTSRWLHVHENDQIIVCVCTTLTAKNTIIFTS